MYLYNFSEIIKLASEPEDQNEFEEWSKQGEVISFLEKDIEDDDIVLYASISHLFIHSVLIPNKPNFSSSDIEDLLGWSYNPYSSWGLTCSRDEAWIEKPLSSAGSKLLEEGTQIIFGRSFEGDESRNNYYELNQKIAHVLGLHYLEERNSWCRLDKHGDIEDIVKIIKVDDLPRNETGTLITIRKDVLGEFASIESLCLIRMFDITRFKAGNFHGWSHKVDPVDISDGEHIFGSLVVDPGIGSYSRGVQVEKISVPDEQVIDNAWGGLSERKEKKYASFIAQDWKNKVIDEISCNPICLANYFTESELPFEITPAFFKPEVMLKYKSDRAKYYLDHRSVGCRGAWHLETFDTNSAGQVHTYLIYLSRLPYEEQLHWKQYNEEPKAPLSKRAYKTDFEGNFYDEYDPLPSLKYKLEKLSRTNPCWWKLRNDDLAKKVHYPFTASKDEWAEEILNLDQVLVEGFEEKWLRNKVIELGGNPDKRLRALKLAEEYLVLLKFEREHAHQIMTPFHIVHNLRSFVKGHASGSEAEKQRKDALREHGTYKAHFSSLCADCDESMEILIDAFQ